MAVLHLLKSTDESFSTIYKHAIHTALFLLIDNINSLEVKKGMTNKDFADSKINQTARKELFDFMLSEYNYEISDYQFGIVVTVLVQYINAGTVKQSKEEIVDNLIKKATDSNWDDSYKLCKTRFKMIKASYLGKSMTKQQLKFNRGGYVAMWMLDLYKCKAITIDDIKTLIIE